MASGTVEKVSEIMIPGMEVVRLNLDNGDTYVSRKFSTIDNVQATLNGGGSGSVAASWSSRTVTVAHGESTSTDVSLIIIGE